MLPDRPVDLLILGLGNVLCRDDGLGVAAAHLLARRYRFPPGVRVMDGGTLGLSLLPYVEDARQAILLDAIRADGPPGTLVRLEGDDVAPAVEARLSPHQIGVADLLHGARWHDRLPPLVLLGLVPESIDLGLGLSPAVQAGLEALVEGAAEEARRRGHRLRSGGGDEERSSLAPGGLARALGL